MHPEPDPGRLPAGTLETAAVTWHGDQCTSLDTGDRYFSPDGSAEVHRVFMAPAELTQRFARQSGTFTCGELGFGSALSFAVIATEFLRRAWGNARLHFISVEARPLAMADMQHMAQRWGARYPLLHELAASYPALLPGWHRVYLGAERICLSLFLGPASAGLADIAGRQRMPVDHWLLDGFAPPLNPSLWQPAVFDQLAQFSAPGSTVTTYSAVGQVRRDLTASGFTMRRVDQMPHKLHSLAGVFTPASNAAPTTWPAAVTVLGAGIAGAATARALALRGVAVTVCDPAGRPGAAASRIPAAALHGRLLPDGSAAAAWQLASYHYSHTRLQPLRAYRPTGVLQRPGPNTTSERLERLLALYGPSGDWLRLAETAAPGTAVALQFRIGGVVHGGHLCRQLLEHPNIEFRTVSGQPVADGHLVLANGVASRDHPAAGYLELTELPGQAELCSHPNPPTQPILGDGYVAPCPGGLIVGSTYEYQAWTPSAARAANLARWPDHGTVRASFRASRTISSDRLPLIGPLADTRLVPFANVQVVTAFGSAGMTGAPLAGEMVAANLTGEFAPIDRATEQALLPGRLRERQARRGPRLGARLFSSVDQTPAR